MTIWDIHLPPNVHSSSWRIVRVPFLTGPNHLSQGVRYHAEGCVALGWSIASVVNDPLGAPGSTPLYLCLPPVRGTAGGDLLNPHYSWDYYGDQINQNNQSKGPKKEEGLPYKEIPKRMGLEVPVHH
jgi:hypothetical protein